MTVTVVKALTSKKDPRCSSAPRFCWKTTAADPVQSTGVGSVGNGYSVECIEESKHNTDETNGSGVATEVGRVKDGRGDDEGGNAGVDT